MCARQSMARALEFLYALGALDDACKLTDPLGGPVTSVAVAMLTHVGIQLAEFPLEPPEAQMLLSSARFGCSEEILTIVAMVQVSPVPAILQRS